MLTKSHEINIRKNSATGRKTKKILVFAPLFVPPLFLSRIDKRGPQKAKDRKNVVNTITEAVFDKWIVQGRV